MKVRLLCSASLVVAAVALVATSAQAGILVFQESFENGAPTYAAGSFGFQYGIPANPNIVASGTGGITSPDGSFHVAQNTAATNTAETILGRSRSAIETVAAAGVTYTFTGEFGWQFGAANIGDLFLQQNNTGFGFTETGATIPGGNLSTQGGHHFFNTQAASTFGTVTYSYTTVAADIGKTLEAWLELRDLGNAQGLNQMLADNFVVMKTPEPATIGLLGLAGMALIGIRPRKD